MELTTSEIINITLCVLSFLLAAISVIIVVLTLRQNSKMIEASTRPYVSIYGAVANFQTPGYYIIVKNFGKTGALITRFESDFDLLRASYSPDHRPFGHLVNTLIAPEQSFACAVQIKEFKSNGIETINFQIEYSSGKKVYSESFSLNIETHSDLILPRASTRDQELKIISYALQEMVQKNL